MRRALLACLLPITATISSCLAPTAITLDIRTNACTALSRTDIYIGDATAPATSTGGCTDSANQEIGTITVLPSGSLDAHIDIAVVASVGDACSSPSTTDANCIIAKRSLSFQPHTTLPIPIFLDGACAGVPCPTGTTCVADSSGAHCQSQTCDVDGGLACASDAGLPGDGGIIADAIGSTDGPVATCANVVDAGVPKRLWSFDPQGDGKIHEDHGDYVVPLVTGNAQTTSGVVFCGPYLSVPVSQPLTPAADTFFAKTPLALAFAYRTVKDGTILDLQSSGPVGGGFHIGMSNGVLNVYVHGVNFDLLVFTDSATTNNGTWHRFAMVLAPTDGGSTAMTGYFTRDNQPPTANTVNYVSTSGPLLVGSIGAIDQLAFY